jgi:small-conductance mechanosensitive channel
MHKLEKVVLCPIFFIFIYLFIGGIIFSFLFIYLLLNGLLIRFGLKHLVLEFSVDFLIKTKDCDVI